MTKFAKLDAPSLPLDRSAPVLRAEPSSQPGQKGATTARPPRIDNALMAELESALQAVVTRAPLPRATEPEVGEAVAIPQQAPGAEPPQDDLEHAGDGGGASEPAPPPYLLLRPAETPEPPRTAPRWEPDAVAEERRPVPIEARRSTLPLGAALCVAGLLGLAGAGGAGLMFTAAPDDEFEPPLAKQVRTESIRATVAPAAVNAQLEPAEEEAASQDRIATGAPTGTAAADTPAGEVTLLRPVGERRAAAVEAPAPLQGVQEPRNIEVATQVIKTPDRLVGPTASTGFPRVTESPASEAPGGSTGTDEARSPTASFQVEPTGGPSERLPSDISDGTGQEMVAAVPAPLPEKPLVASTGPNAEDDSAATADTSLEAAGETAPELAAGASTRSAPVTSAVNMRSGPENGAGVLTVVPAGSEVQVISCDHWCEVVFGGERGWIYRSFIGTSS